jgi:hypothetical protein
MADSSSKSNDNNDLDAKQSSVPAWKLRESMRAQGTTMRPNSAHNVQKLRQSQGSNAVDPNLPPAFRAVFQQRAAFSKQQARRKNNDEFVSLNSSHPDRPSQVQAEDSDHLSDFDDSFASMGEDIAEEGEENQE